MSAVDAILPHEPVTVTLDLPFPPSKNRLWRRSKGKPEKGKKGGMYMSPQYASWIRTADGYRMMQRPSAVRTINVPFETLILINSDSGIGDSHNRIECVMDYLQRIEVISNDKLSRRTAIEWVEASKAPYGCRVIIKELA